MTIYDVSVPLSNEMPTWPGDPAIQISAMKSMEKGDSSNVSLLHLGAHTGTHVDAPAHFIAGANKLESMPLDALLGPAVVVEVPEDQLSIELDFVEAHCPPTAERILFKTRNSAFWANPAGPFRSDFTYLSTEGATKLVNNGIRLVGIDYLSIEKFGQKSHATHLALLSKGVVIIEGLDLREVPAGTYELICLPLRLRSGPGDGSPVRAVLRTLD
jgi:arylformamidase